MKDRLFLAWQAVCWRSGWCRHDYNWGFGWSRIAWYKNAVTHALFDASAVVQRVFYTVKVVLLVLLTRRGDLYAKDGIEVAAWGMRPWTSMDFPGTAYDFEILAVAPGWRHWSWDSYETSTA